MSMGLVVLPVCVYYLVAKQPDSEKEQASAAHSPEVYSEYQGRGDAMARVLRRAQLGDEEQSAQFRDLVRGGASGRRRQTAHYTGPLAEAERRDREVQMRARFGLPPVDKDGDKDADAEADEDASGSGRR
ncbi:hypothetical protein FNF27_07627 [Cafeteria roenbergensis]|nr:hypothetical protein FNF29_02964 [Cafeteria roenbergensis]KAA0159971.1 hypothetical protein FNF31_04616 [Cafeteria roenbergensis]KAA0165619.1 hypothetical protein FNF27_07627 [Cafeteria roenbergensis]|eukprot:KAA0153576.1 hypothetical protein FNF29_02964 [Cafeteria roenbergensis]